MLNSMTRAAFIGICAIVLSALAAVAADEGSEPPGIGAAGNPSELPGNLAANAGFEEKDNDRPLPANWDGDQAVYSLDTSTARSGRGSLRFADADPNRYRLCSQTVPILPGRKYRFSVYVKTQGIVGTDSGGTLCLECRDENGKWVGGAYPPGIKGTRDWTRVECVKRVPREARSFRLICYVRKGMTGQAWFDDVSLVRVVDPPMHTLLTSPVYRGQITAGMAAQIRLRARLNWIDYEWQPEDLLVHAELQSVPGGEVLRKSSARPRADQPCDLELPTEGLAVGQYAAVVMLTGAHGKILQSARHDLVRVSDDFKARTSVDSHLRLVVDGKPFFPLGMYWGSINEKDMKLYADSKFNCLMPYGLPDAHQMDIAHKHGLRVIYSIKDFYAGSRWCPKFVKTEADEEPNVRGRVRDFRDHPALLAWYLNDELPREYMPRLEAHQRWVTEEDPHHPTWVVLWQVHDVSKYINSFDVIGTDPYPIGGHPVSMVAEWTAETLRQVEMARPVWQVVQAQNRGNMYAENAEEKKKHRTPSYEETRCMAWQSICEGANGIVLYSFFDAQRNPDVPFETQWPRLKRIAAEIDRMAPVLLSVEPAPRVKAECEPARPNWLHWLTRGQRGKAYLFAVNNGDGEGTVTFAFPSSSNVRRVKVLGEDRTIEVDGGRFTDRLRKLDVRIYEGESL